MNTHAQSYWQRERWPLIKSIWVFGSVLGEGFHEESDIDLMVEGLPPQDLLGAIKLAEPMLVDRWI